MSEKGGVKILIAILVILIIAAGVILACKIMKDKNNETTAVSEENKVLTAAIEER